MHHITIEPIKHKAQHDNMRGGGLGYMQGYQPCHMPRHGDYISQIVNLKVKIINQGASSLKSTSNNKT